MRRISTGIQGRSILGSFVAETNRFTTREVNQDLVLEPDGTGIVRSASDFKIDGTNGSLILETNDGNDIKLQTAAGASYTLTMPTSAPADGQVLISDASGNLTFDDINLPVSNQTADTATYYPLMNTATSGDITGVSVSSSKFTFQPSSGTLTATGFNGTLTSSSVTVTGGTINGTSVGASTRNTGAFTTLQANGAVTITSTTTARQINPEANNTYDLGTSALRWRTIFTQDLELSNGIGDFTIVEGEDDLFIYNNKRSKVYKFALIEVDPSEATPKIADLQKGEDNSDAD